jgi:hypothetical protein
LREYHDTGATMAHTWAKGSFMFLAASRTSYVTVELPDYDQPPLPFPR